MLIKTKWYHSPNYFSHRAGKQKMINSFCRMRNSTHGSTFEGYIPLLGIIVLLCSRTKHMQEWNSSTPLLNQTSLKWQEHNNIQKMYGRSDFSCRDWSFYMVQEGTRLHICPQSLLMCLGGTTQLWGQKSLSQYENTIIHQVYYLH
jgi:hypothetical protein